MATTPPTSISSSYQRLGGPTPVITQTAPGPKLSPATQERLRLQEEGKLFAEQMAAEQRQKAASMLAANKQREEEEKAQLKTLYGWTPGKKLTAEQAGDWSARQDAARQSDLAARTEAFKNRLSSLKKGF